MFYFFRRRLDFCGSSQTLALFLFGLFTPDFLSLLFN